MNKLRRFFKRFGRSKVGFTLVEVIVATALVLIISSTMLPLFAQGNYYIARAKALRVQASEANESIKLGRAITSDKNTIVQGEEELYKIRTSLNLGGLDPKTGGSSQEYIFIRASSSNGAMETIVIYSDFSGVKAGTG
ncbi:MAG: type II secretion system protein [Clostridia bacterium]|nr:type II secretion system protein [Clostridia bacterium]